jgi:hypothetical protein
VKLADKALAVGEELTDHVELRPLGGVQGDVEQKNRDFRFIAFG